MSEQPAAVKTWSQQQHEIFAWFRAGKGNAVVRARAGTGKTTTIIEGILGAPELRILLCAFNARIKEELAARNANPNADVKTLHGVGYACVRNFLQGVSMIDGFKREDRLVEEVCAGSQVPVAVKRLIGKLITKGREMAPLAAEASELLDIALEYECEPDESWQDAGFDTAFVCQRAVEGLAAAAKVPAIGAEIDFADQLFLPVRNGWLQKTYDLVVVDEAQDMSMTQLIIARGVCRGRMAIVGDDRQAVYGFRGADSGSLDRLKAELGAEEYPLTVTYRCAKAIVAEAQALVPDLQAADGAAEGQISHMDTFDQLIGAAEVGNFILSRSNAPLARVAMALIRANKPARIQGKDIGAGLKSLVRKLAQGKASNSIPEFLARLARWEERECERARKSEKPERAEGIRDKAETLRCVCEGTAGIREVEARLDRLFSDSGAGVVCSSVHKAKGLEAPMVYVLRKTLYPKPPKDAKVTAMRRREEANIHYVAITRAQQHLCYVDVK